jgi:hypothetical protein
MAIAGTVGLQVAGVGLCCVVRTTEGFVLRGFEARTSKAPPDWDVGRGCLNFVVEQLLLDAEVFLEHF